MDVFQKIDGVLKGLNTETRSIPYYYGMPEFDRDVPDNYITYSTYEVPSCFGDGCYHKKLHTVTVDIFSNHIDPALYEEIEKAMVNAGFTYKIGRSMGEETAYPHICRWTQEYTIEIGGL